MIANARGPLYGPPPSPSPFIPPRGQEPPTVQRYRRGLAELLAGPDQDGPSWGWTISGLLVATAVAVLIVLAAWWGIATLWG